MSPRSVRGMRGTGGFVWHDEAGRKLAARLSARRPATAGPIVRLLPEAVAQRERMVAGAIAAGAITAW